MSLAEKSQCFTVKPYLKSMYVFCLLFGSVCYLEVFSKIRFTVYTYINNLNLKIIIKKIFFLLYYVTYK